MGEFRKGIAWAIDFDDCLHATDRAVLLRIDEDDVWVPRSVIHGEEPEPECGPGSVEIEDWFLQKEGLV